MDDWQRKYADLAHILTARDEEIAALKEGSMSNNDPISAKLMQPFPREAIKTRQGGGNSRLSYVEGHTVIHRLIAATANQFDLRVLNLEQKGDLLTALVELTLPGLGSRQHIGVQKVSERGGEDLVKGAITDALKKAATLFGVGLELYGPDYGSDEPQAPAPRQTTPQRGAQSARAAAPAPAPMLTADRYQGVIAAAWKARRSGVPYEDIIATLREVRDTMTSDQYADTQEEVEKLKAWTPEGEPQS